MRWFIGTVLSAVVGFVISTGFLFGFPILGDPQRLQHYWVESAYDVWYGFYPSKPSTKLRVLIVRLQDDPDEENTTVISDAFKRISAVEVVDISRELTVERATADHDIQENAKIARKWEKLRNADMLIWGYRRAGKTYLYFVTPKSSVPCKYRPQQDGISLEEDETLPETARKDFSKAVLETIRSTTLPFCIASESFPASELERRIEKVKLILDSKEFRFSEDQQVDLRWTFARGASVLFGMTGKRGGEARREFEWLTQKSLLVRCNCLDKLADVSHDFSLLDTLYWERTHEAGYLVQARARVLAISGRPGFDDVGSVVKGEILILVGWQSFQLGEIYGKPDDYRLAEKSLQNAVTILDGDTSSDVGINIRVRELLGFVQLRLGRMDSSVATLRHAVDNLQAAESLCGANPKACSSEQVAQQSENIGLAFFALANLTGADDDFAASVMFLQTATVRYQQARAMEGLETTQSELRSAQASLAKKKASRKPGSREDRARPEPSSHTSWNSDGPQFPMISLPAMEGRGLSR